MFRNPRSILLCILLLCCSCAKREFTPDGTLTHPLQLEQNAELVTLVAQLNGEYRHDLARLQLREDLLGEPRYLADGRWLLQLANERGQFLYCVTPGEGREKQQPVLLANADSIALVSLRQSDSRQWPWQLLLREERAETVEVLQVAPDGRRRSLQKGVRGNLHLLQDPLRLRLPQEEAHSQFHEEPGSMHLEIDVPLMEHRDGWVLGDPLPVENSYRCLNRFIEAVRRGKWSRAERNADLALMLALPNGGHSPRLAASMKLSEPELLDRKLSLRAPAYGPLRRFSSMDGRFSWVVDFRSMPDKHGSMRYLITRLERVRK